MFTRVFTRLIKIILHNHYYVNDNNNNCCILLFIIILSRIESNEHLCNCEDDAGEFYFTFHDNINATLHTIDDIF